MFSTSRLWLAGFSLTIPVPLTCLLGVWNGAHVLLALLCRLTYNPCLARAAMKFFWNQFPLYCVEGRHGARMCPNAWWRRGLDN